MYTGSERALVFEAVHKDIGLLAVGTIFWSLRCFCLLPVFSWFCCTFAAAFSLSGWDFVRCLLPSGSRRRHRRCLCSCHTLCSSTLCTPARFDRETAGRKEGGEIRIFICDIDNFKQVNDRFGHAFGDYCICSFTKAIREHFRKDNILGRIGGDEFVVFIPYSSERWLEEKAAELSKALDMVCTKEQSSCQVSASIGISISLQAGSRFDQLYQSADSALYQTKKNGKNGFTIMELTGEKVADSTDL